MATKTDDVPRCETCGRLADYWVVSDVPPGRLPVLRIGRERECSIPICDVCIEDEAIVGALMAGVGT